MKKLNFFSGFARLAVSNISFFIRFIFKLMDNEPMATDQRYTSPSRQVGDVQKRKFVQVFSFPANKNNAFIFIGLEVIFIYFTGG
jgi:hypothetical protein